MFSITAIVAIFVSAQLMVGALTLKTAFAATPSPVMFGYVPLPADDFQTVLENANPDANTTLDFTVGITSAAAGAVLYYDEWEDGYEADLTNSAQTTTQVWGDANTANGDASLVCTACAGDLLPSGSVFVLRNNITTPRNTSQIRYDGRDKIASTRGFTLSAGGFTSPLGSVLSSVVSSYDSTKYGTDFYATVGQNTTKPAGTSNAFKSTSLMIMASKSGTFVQVDKDANGSFETTQTIGEGEPMLVNGGVLEAAHIVSDKPVQVHLATGDDTVNYEARIFTLFPTPLLASSYMNPVGSTESNQRTIVYLFNQGSSTITVTPTCTSCSGTISIPSRSGVSFPTPLGEAVRFASSGGTFSAVGAVGSQSGAPPDIGQDHSQRYDWGFTLVPTSQLTTNLIIGWAPGNSAIPPTPNPDYSPIWVTTQSATTIKVDFDNDSSTGAIGTADCFGARHDLDISVGALISTRIFDAIDGDMTGARIYTCDSTKIAGAWGQDPATAEVNDPGFDAGYTLIPSTIMLVEKTSSLYTDANSDGMIGLDDTITYDIAISDAGALAFTSLVASDTLVGSGGTYVLGSTSLFDGTVTTPITDDTVGPAATAFPLDESGLALPDINPGNTLHIRYRTLLPSSLPAGQTTVTNSVEVTATEASASDVLVTTLANADLSLDATLTTTPSVIGDNAVIRLTLENAGPNSSFNTEVKVYLPTGCSYVSNVASQGTYASGTGIWTVGTVASGATKTLDITCSTSATSSHVYAEVSSSDAIDPNSQPMENSLDSTHPVDQDDEIDQTITATAAPATASGKVFKDANGDGVMSGAEPGIGGVGITVLWAGPNGTFGNGDDVSVNTTTDGSGNWSTSNLSIGNYQVTVDHNTLPSGVNAPSSDKDGINTPHWAAFTLTSGQVVSDANFGYKGSSSISSIVFTDSNSNATKDSGETGVAGATVTLLADLDNNGSFETTIGSTTTASDGSYSFSGLVPGSYSASVSTPTGKRLTTASTYTFVLAAGQTSSSANFGLVASDFVATTGTNIVGVVVLGASLVLGGLTLAFATRTRGKPRRRELAQIFAK